MTFASHRRPGYCRSARQRRRSGRGRAGPWLTEATAGPGPPSPTAGARRRTPGAGGRRTRRVGTAGVTQTDGSVAAVTGPRVAVIVCQCDVVLSCNHPAGPGPGRRGRGGPWLPTVMVTARVTSPWQTPGRPGLSHTDRTEFLCASEDFNQSRARHCHRDS